MKELGLAIHGGIRFWTTVSQEVGKGCKGRRRRQGKVWDVGGATGTFILRTVSPCRVSHIFSTALHGNVNWLCRAARTTKIRQLESETLRLTFRPELLAGEEWVAYSRGSRGKYGPEWRKLNLSTMGEELPKILKAMSWAAYDDDVPVLNTLRSILGWKITTW